MPPAAAPPSIYQNMATMATGGAKPPDAAAGPKGEAGAGPGGMEEKKQILTTLLEVFKKWDKLETDESGKKIISDMVSLAERYKKEVLKEGGETAPPPGPGGEAPPPPAGGDVPGGMGKPKGPDVPS